MEMYPGKMKPEQPGINGIRYAAKLGLPLLHLETVHACEGER
jgi:hypothetical protein